MLSTKLIISNLNHDCFIIKQIPLMVNTIRFGHTMRGKRPGYARSLEKRMQDESVIDRELTECINIGYPQLRPSRSQELKHRLDHIKKQRNDVDIEKAARLKTLDINLKQVHLDWLKKNGQFHIKRIAEHFGIYKHLFGYAYFIPRIPIDVKYKLSGITKKNTSMAGDAEIRLPVYWGNIIKPKDTILQPEIKFDASVKLLGEQDNIEQTYWTLLMTNPDGHLTESNKEYAHLFVGNIPNGDFTKGEIIMPYLQPFPPKGTGYHRHIFILYRQNKKMDFSKYKITKLNDLVGRTFSTSDFYRQYQDDITPAGLAFFQSNWDDSVHDTFHNLLQMKEPCYEYDFPRPYIKDQEWFPLRQPFNLYMDKYRDPKQVSKEFLERKLAKTDPFHGPQQKLRFPNAHPLRNIPSWLLLEIRKERLGWGRVNDV